MLSPTTSAMLCYVMLCYWAWTGRTASVQLEESKRKIHIKYGSKSHWQKSKPRMSDSNYINLLFTINMVAT